MEKKREIAVLEIRNEITTLNIRSFTFYADPGHGWLGVPAKLLSLLQIEDEITTFSYVSRDRSLAYLEQDCDASTFCNAYKNVMGMSAEQFLPMTQRAYQENCFIRSLPSYKMNKAN